jgi:hypothetical protein
VLNAQEVLQTVGEDLVDDDSGDLVVVFDLFSELHFLFGGFEGVGVGVREVGRLEEVEDGLGLDLAGNDSLLAGLFVLLFLLDLLDGEVLADPLDHAALSLDGLLLLEHEPHAQFLILDDLVFSEAEDDGEVVGALLVDHMDLFEVLEQLLIVLAHGFLDHGGAVEAFIPVALDFAGVEVFGDLLDFFFVEVFFEIFEFFLLDVALSLDDFGDLGGMRCTLLRTGSSCLRYFFSISRVALFISSSMRLISLYRL